MNQIALVTGGNRGLGFGLCRALAEKGYHVILAARDEESGREKANELKNQGLSVEYQALDVNSEKSIKEAFTTIKNQFGKLDCG